MFFAKCFMCTFLNILRMIFLFEERRIFETAAFVVTLLLIFSLARNTNFCFFNWHLALKSKF